MTCSRASVEASSDVDVDRKNRIGSSTVSQMLLLSVHVCISGWSPSYVPPNGWVTWFGAWMTAVPGTRWPWASTSTW